MSLCPRCGVEIHDGATYCGHCRKVIAGRTPPDSAVPTEKNGPADD